MRPCFVDGCPERVGDHYALCRRHWCLLPPDIRKHWGDLFRRQPDESYKAWGDYANANLAEVLRILRAIEQGVPA